MWTDLSLVMLRRQVLTWQSGRFEPSNSVPGREEVSHPPVVAQDTIDDLSSPGHDLARDPDQILEEGAKLHSQKLIATLTLSDHQCEPGFEVPRQLTEAEVEKVIKSAQEVLR